MVTSVSSLGRSGVSDWIIQRVSAVIMLAWFGFVAFFIATHAPMAYEAWRALFTHLSMRIFTLVTMLALCAHAWIGMWTVATDYLNPRMLGSKATVLRLLFQLVVLAVLATYLIWCIQILWSV